jgi:hypothetical protein
VVLTNPTGHFTVCWDPLDGSSIVDNNWSVGTIIGIWGPDSGTGEDGLIGATGRDQVAPRPLPVSCHTDTVASGAERTSRGALVSATVGLIRIVIPRWWCGDADHLHGGGVRPAHHGASGVGRRRVRVLLRLHAGGLPALRRLLRPLDLLAPPHPDPAGLEDLLARQHALRTGGMCTASEEGWLGTGRQRVATRATRCERVGRLRELISPAENPLLCRALIVRFASSRLVGTRSC